MPLSTHKLNNTRRHRALYPEEQHAKLRGVRDGGRGSGRGILYPGRGGGCNDTIITAGATGKTISTQMYLFSVYF